MAATASPKSIAFAITVDDEGTLTAPLDAVNLSPRGPRKMLEKRGLRNSLSTESLTQKLSLAAHRKQSLLDLKSSRAAETVQHARHIASAIHAKEQQEMEETMASLQARLDLAAELKEEREKARLEVVKGHLEVVERRRSGPNSPSTPRRNPLEKLAEAARRREEYEREQMERLHAHDEHVKAVRMRKASMGGEEIMV